MTLGSQVRPYTNVRAASCEDLGDVPDHWAIASLGQLGRFSKGNGGSKDDEVPAGIPCVRYGDLYTEHSIRITRTRSFIARERAIDYTAIHLGDVLFAASGETLEEIGKSAVNLISGEVRVGGDVLIFRAGRPVDPRFLGYACDAAPAVTQKARMGKGVTVMHIYVAALRHLRIAVPPVEEQVAIARFLDHADRRIQRYIRAKQRLIELLEEEKQAIIHHAVTRGLDPNVKLKPSGVEWLCDVPEHWEVVAIGRVIDLLPGFAFPSSDFSTNTEDVRLLRGVNVAAGRVRWGDVVRWRNSQMHGLERYRLRPGDLVLGLDRPVIGTGTRLARVSRSDTPSLLLQRVARIRVRSRLVEEFAWLLLAGGLFRRYMAPIFTGVSVPHLSPRQVKNFRVGLPPVAEQEDIIRSIDARTRSADAAATAARRQISFLREFHTRLISDVVTGKLDVREAAAALRDDRDANESALDESLEQAVA